MEITNERLRDFFSNKEGRVVLNLDLSPEFLYWLASCEIYPPNGPMCKVQDISLDAATSRVTFNIASRPQTVKKPDEAAIEE